MTLLNNIMKKKFKEEGISVMKLLTAWCISADIMSFAVYPFNTLEMTAKLSFSIFLLIFCLQILLLSLLKYFLKNKYPKLERIILPVSFGVYCFVTIAQSNEFFYIVLLCLLWVILFKYYNEQGLLYFKKPLTKNLSIAIITVLAVIFFAIVGSTGVLRYLTFRCPNYDFGIFSQMFYSMKNTLLPLTTCERDKILSHFAVHLSPILYLLLPVYEIFPTPITLPLAQAAILSSAVVPLALLCRKFKMSFTRTTIFSLIMLCYPAIACGTNYDFHENCFLLPLLLWLFYSYEAHRPGMMAVFAVLVMLVKEDAAVYIAFFAIFVFLDGKKYLQGSILFTGACVYFLGAVILLFAYGEGVMMGRYDNFIYGNGTLLQAIKNVLINPGYALLQMTMDGEGREMPKLLFFFQMSVPLAFIPFCVSHPSRLLLLFPMLLVNFMTLYVYQYDIGFQYSFGSSAFLIYLSVINISDMKAKTGRLLLSVSAIAGCLMFISFPIFRFTEYIKDYHKNSATYTQMEQTLSKIPSDSSVACTTLLLPHLSQRETVYETYYHDPEKNEKLDYIILDARDNVDKTLNEYQKLGYEIKKEVEKDGKKILIILQ